MNVIGSKYLLWLLRIWRDEKCAGRVEGAILACGAAMLLMLAAIGLERTLRELYDLASSIAASFLS